MTHRSYNRFACSGEPSVEATHRDSRACRLRFGEDWGVEKRVVANKEMM